MVQLEHLKLRISSLDKSLKSLEFAINKFQSFEPHNELYELLRAGMIQNFEITLDVLWKTFKNFLEISLGITAVSSPKGIAKEAFENQLISQKELDELIELINYRNLTSHTYNEDLAEEIAQEILKNIDFIKNLVNRIKESKI